MIKANCKTHWHDSIKITRGKSFLFFIIIILNLIFVRIVVLILLTSMSMTIKFKNIYEHILVRIMCFYFFFLIQALHIYTLGRSWRELKKNGVSMNRTWVCCGKIHPYLHYDSTLTKCFLWIILHINFLQKIMRNHISNNPDR